MVGAGGSGSRGAYSSGAWGGYTPGNGETTSAFSISATGGFGARVTSVHQVSGYTDGHGGIGGASGNGCTGEVFGLSLAGGLS